MGISAGARSASAGARRIDQRDRVERDHCRRRASTSERESRDAHSRPESCLWHFLDSNPGLASRFSRRIEFPPYSEEELIEILALMANQEHLRLPERFEPRIRPWLAAARRQENWGNARSMRTLVERVREAQSVRIARDLNADLSELTIGDIDRAIERMEAAA